MRIAMTLIAATMCYGAPLAAQSLAQRIQSIDDGEIRISYGTKDGVCGDGRNLSTGQSSDDRSNKSWCEPGPARVSLTMRNGQVVDADVDVGGRWGHETSRTTDLGRVAAPEAAAAFLSLAETARDGAGGSLVVGAAIADSAEIWPDLLRLARKPGLPKDTRDDVILWLGFAAGDALGPEGTNADEDDVRESAIFALSQRPEDEAVPALIRVVEGDLPVHLKKTALFWLGQTDDDRAIDVYEGILRGG